MPKLKTKTVTLKVIGLRKLLDEDEVEDLSSCSDFSWGDTDVTMVSLQNFLKVCDKHDLHPTDGAESLDNDTYVDLNG
jgi:hypothetical protein